MADDEIQALVAAQIRREMEQAELSTPLEKRLTDKTQTAQDVEDTREAEEEEIVGSDVKTEETRSAARSTNSTLVEENEVRAQA